MDSQTVLSHENNLWKLFRILVEEETVPETITNKIKKAIEEANDES